jgi:hypothetical protein
LTPETLLNPCLHCSPIFPKFDIHIVNKQLNHI